jgi:hypothetical protein
LWSGALYLFLMNKQIKDPGFVSLNKRPIVSIIWKSANPPHFR